jgi:hypothetical protein
MKGRKQANKEDRKEGEISNEVCKGNFNKEPST